ncbi:site-specific integrase [Mariniflexile sp.]|uniref:site-specific integrase n=1 Tax=Mariniflexile sp. TaxID=1979402 RepID=UPI004048D9A5
MTHWDNKTKRAKPRILGAKILNSYLDDVYANLLDCHKQLTSEHKLITANNIKARFLGEDEQHKTLLELMDYHNTNMKTVLRFGTLKNYFTTEKYLKKFITEKLKTSDVYLKQLTYSFIIDFEQFLRNTKSINRSQPLNNNGVMKHLERFKKLLSLAVDLEWIEKNPFARFKLKFQKYDREFLSKPELETLEQGVLEQDHHKKTRDVFVFACYTGLSYIDVKQLKKRVLMSAVLEFVYFGLKDLYPQKRGAIVRGVVTAHSAMHLVNKIQSNQSFVWPYNEGNQRGFSVEPLHPNVPKACLKNVKLYELLALLDAIRLGNV